MAENLDFAACQGFITYVFRKLRRNLTVTFFMSVIVNVGMWFERFVIIVTSVYRDYLPSSWSTCGLALSPVGKFTVWYRPSAE